MVPDRRVRIQDIYPRQASPDPIFYIESWYMPTCLRHTADQYPWILRSHKIWNHMLYVEPDRQVQIWSVYLKLVWANSFKTNYGTSVFGGKWNRVMHRYKLANLGTENIFKACLSQLVLANSRPLILWSQWGLNTKRIWTGWSESA